MIIIKLKGGLGNQLFQYAFGRLLSLKYDKGKLLLDKDILSGNGDTVREYGLGNYCIKAEIASPEEVLRSKYPYGIFSKAFRFFDAKIMRNYHIGYEPELLKSNQSYFDGYFQSYKYLEPIRSQLLEEISLLRPTSKEFNEMAQDMNTTQSVSIHIRRGDYVTNEQTKSEFSTFGPEYYQECQSFFQSKIRGVQYFVFSDDISWAKEFLKGNCYSYVSSPRITDYEELVLMSRCKNNIIANSSFSFWGAWLNQNPLKIVVAPKKWNNKYIQEYADLLPPKWQRL